MPGVPLADGSTQQPIGLPAEDGQIQTASLEPGGRRPSPLDGRDCPGGISSEAARLIFVEMNKADWIALAPTLINPLVTLTVAFGVWRLTSMNERRRERERVKREERNHRAEIYANLYASLSAWPNIAREAFIEPTDREALAAYDEAMHEVATDYGQVLMLGGVELAMELQPLMTLAIGTLDGVMADRRTDGNALSVDDARSHPHGMEFLKGKQQVLDARSALLGLARRDLGLPGKWVRVDPRVAPTGR